MAWIWYSLMKSSPSNELLDNKIFQKKSLCKNICAMDEMLKKWVT